jgi:hypothetical protein
MYLIQIGWGGMDQISLTQDRDHWRTLVNKVMNNHVPLTAVNSLSSCTTGGLSRRAQLHRVMP